MAKNNLFRGVLIGGYHKGDVLEYVEKLEKEIERLEKVESAAVVLEQKVADLLKKESSDEALPKEELGPNQNEVFTNQDTEEFRQLQYKAQQYDEKYAAIKQLILDSRIEAQVILTDAKQKADRIIEEAQKKAVQMEADLKQPIDNQLLQLLGSTGMVQRELETMQSHISGIMERLSEERSKLHEVKANIMISDLEQEAGTDQDSQEPSENSAGASEETTGLTCEEE